MARPTIDHYERYAPDRIQDFTEGGVPGIIVTVRDGDVLDWDSGNIGPSGKPNERAEISYAPSPSADKAKAPSNVHEGMLQTYDYEFLFDPGFPPHRWAMVAQFHPRDDLTGTFMGFTGISLHDSNITLGDPNDSTGTVFFVSRPIRVGVKYPWRLAVKWASDKTGYVKAVDRVTSELLGRYDGPTIPAGSWAYLKQGLYRDGASTATATLRQKLVDIQEGDLTVAPADQAKQLYQQLTAHLVAAVDVNSKIGALMGWK